MIRCRMFFFFNDTATTEIYTLSLHDALPILQGARPGRGRGRGAQARPGFVVPAGDRRRAHHAREPGTAKRARNRARSEEHTSELQSRQYLVCRLLLEKKKK